ncbi:DUF5319 family protein [Corynebacterium lubricantis]|uniref:DUF5319 domain-containing protein n=1 Tax=Corynebacterium lubricantis TaxID=541095 RepID=UPI00036547C2
MTSVNYDSMMPRDPFADDPNDPASFLDEEHIEPLSDDERAAVLEDLRHVREFRQVLKPRGILGIYFLCEDCDQMHFYDWDIMETNMVATLGNQIPPVHEPSVEPDPNAFVPWDYALGYLDGLESR